MRWALEGTIGCRPLPRVIYSAVPPPMHDWSIRISDGQFGLIQERADETILYYGRNAMELPFNAPDIMLSSVGFWLVLIYFALIARRRWRRG
jgi:hypothetical protein